MTVTVESVPTLHHLPASLLRESAVEIELEEGILIFRASKIVQNRIEDLLFRQNEFSFTTAEKKELEEYEDIDDYLSFLNRLTRNLAKSQSKGDPSVS